MAGFDHGVNRPSADEPANVRATRAGHVLFVLYLALYVAFVLGCAFAPGIMARTPWAGINVAVLAGLALIVIAFGLALLYDWLCRMAARPAPDAGETPA